MHAPHSAAPPAGPPPPLHRRLEWYRHLGLDAMVAYPISQLAFVVAELGSLAAFAVLSSNGVRKNAAAWFPPSEHWGNASAAPLDSCEYAGPDALVKQPSTAFTAWCFVGVGLAVVFLGLCDCGVAAKRLHALVRGYEMMPYSKGPGGETDYKVTAISSVERGQAPSFEPVDPEYLRGNHPSLLRRHPAWSLLLGFSLLFLGGTAFTYEASLTPLARQLYSFALFTVASAFTALAAARMLDGLVNVSRINLCCCFEPCGVQCTARCESGARRKGALAVSTIFFAFSAGLDLVAWFLIDLETAGNRYATLLYALMGLLIAFSLYWHYWARKRDVDTFWTLGMLGTFFVSLGWMFRIYDSRTCAPGSFFQPFAVWQVCLAAALLCFYLMLRGDAWLYETVFAREHAEDRLRGDAFRVPGVARSGGASDGREAGSDGGAARLPHVGGVPGAPPLVATPVDNAGGFEVNLDAIRERRRMASAASGAGAGGGAGASFRAGAAPVEGVHVGNRVLVPRPAEPEPGSASKKRNSRAPSTEHGNADGDAGGGGRRSRATSVDQSTATASTPHTKAAAPAPGASGPSPDGKARIPSLTEAPPRHPSLDRNFRAPSASPLPGGGEGGEMRLVGDLPRRVSAMSAHSGDRQPSPQRPVWAQQGSTTGLPRVGSVQSMGSTGSRGSIRLEQLRAQAQQMKAQQSSQAGSRTSLVPPGSAPLVGRWTCPACGYSENLATFVVCASCEARRPSGVAVPS